METISQVNSIKTMDIINPTTSTTEVDENLSHHYEQSNYEDSIKYQYSTFIEELEETAQRLMDKVFNSDYPHELNDLQRNSESAKLTTCSSQLSPKNSDYCTQNNSRDYDGNDRRSFQEFLRRSKKWQQTKEINIDLERIRQQERKSKQLTYKPEIVNRKLCRNIPLYERAYQLHQQQEKKKQVRRIQQQRVEETRIAELSFHPHINITAKCRIKPRTLHQYLKDQDEWLRKKSQKESFQKVQNETRRFQECSFTPELVSKQPKKHHEVKDTQTN